METRLETLSRDQEALIPIIRDKWIEKAYNPEQKLTMKSENL